MATTFYTPAGPSPWFSNMQDVPQDFSGVDPPSNQFVGSGGLFDKGYTPPPVTIVNHNDGVGIRLVFDSSVFNSSGCVCNINCSGAVFLGAPVGSQGPIVVCPITDGYAIDIVMDTTGVDPVPISIEYTDAQGNVSTTEIGSIGAIEPQTLSYVTGQESGVDYIEMGIPFLTTAGTGIRDDVSMWQIERFVTNEANSQLIIDWTVAEPVTRPTQFLYRTGDVARISLTSGTTYGFRVRYRSALGEISPWSGWITVTV